MPDPTSSPYVPAPIPTDGVELPAELDRLAERLAEHVHDLWALGRLADGWRYGPARNDGAKTHPGLVPYSDLDEGEKAFDRRTALGTLRAILALGYRIVPPRGDHAGST